MEASTSTLTFDLILLTLGCCICQFSLLKKSSLTKPFITGVSLRTKCGLAQGPLAYFLGPSLSCLPTKYITPPSPWPPHWAFEWSRALAVMWRAHWSIPKGQNKITAWPDGTAHSAWPAAGLGAHKTKLCRWLPTEGASGSNLASARQMVYRWSVDTLT